MISAVKIVALVQTLALSANGIRIVQSNDDGWAEQNIRTLNDALIASGHQVLLSGPAQDNSGTGSSDTEPSPRTSACQYNSCPPNSGPVGFNSTRRDLFWVNSYPVTSIRYGIDTFAPQLWNGEKPQLAVAGPNVGSNIWLAVPFSGTVGAACYAAHDAGIPAIAFSGADGTRHAWNERPESEPSLVYAAIAANLTNIVIASGQPYLPADVFLNVNFPKLSDKCKQPSDFKFVLSRINPGLFSPPDVDWCGSTRLPTENHVEGQDGCYVSVSIGDAKDKTTVNDDRQKVVLDKLRSILTCLP